jgi:hypothetical protein
MVGSRPWTLVAHETSDGGVSLNLLGTYERIGNVHPSAPSDATVVDAVYFGRSVLFGAVDASAASVLVHPDGGDTVQASLVPIPGSIGEGLQAFVASTDGAPRGELEVLDAAGNVLAIRRFYPHVASSPAQ